MAIEFGSLFAGIGGIDLGLERAGMVCKWQVEIDDYATKVLEKHWPNVARFRDVRECGRHNLEWVDLICGGFPCQDISYAGKGAGIKGERSGLWSEFYRIICELRPRFVLVENVAALLNRGMGRVLGDLAACGYDAEWECLPAAAFGAPHIRDRVFIFAYTESHLWEASRNDRSESSNGSDSLLAHATEFRWHEAQIETPTSHKECGRSQGQIGRCGGAKRKKNWWSIEPDVGRVADGIPARVDRLRGLGNAVVPQIAEWIGKRMAEMSEKGDSGA